MLLPPNKTDGWLLTLKSANLKKFLPTVPYGCHRALKISVLTALHILDSQARKWPDINTEDAGSSSSLNNPASSEFLLVKELC